MATRNQILGHSMLLTRLRQREVGQGSKVLIKRHVVINILITSDARQRVVGIAFLYRQTVHNCCAAIETGVVISNLPSGGILVGITTLAAYRQ